ncbi:MAG TPA: response regulator [Candidatus Eisenbergiella merdavium]|uniref:Stage 0 sporulation protein A homolog n=1 Tax=Candidatus Eisenbergiella merdavium TaxID=2838551 RepID=A0A9D2SQ17_9FIRM|nr:response regulator [Candidatus Eisenbergiella merdavium]
MKLLIADDEIYMLDYLKKLVDWEAYGFDQIFTAGGGSLARDLLVEKQPELLITDIKMPRISGLDLCALVEEKGYSTSIIIVSGYGEFEYAKRAMRYGVSEYLVKPILKADMEEVMDRLLKSRPEWRERVKKEEGNGTGRDRKELIAYIQKYISDNFDKPLSLDMIGEAVHLHPAYLSGLFKEETGGNLSGYIADVRMQKAAELLEQTELRVNEIMCLTGYRKSQHFTKLFREKFGATPMEYRRKKQIGFPEGGGK